MTDTARDIDASLSALVDIMARLRDPERGCPWDLKQDFHTIVPHTLEEAYELADAVESGETAEIKDELGDVLFSVINYARFLNMDPESALERTNKKFIGRFTHMERQIKEQGLLMQEMSLSELEAFWRSAKKQD